MWVVLNAIFLFKFLTYNGNLTQSIIIDDSKFMPTAYPKEP